MPERTRRGFLAGAGAALVAGAGCLGTAEDSADTPDGPAEYPDSPTLFDGDRWVETADAAGRYRPVSVDVTTEIHTATIRSPTPDAWHEAGVTAVEPADPLVFVVMEFQNLAKGPDDIPAVDTGTALVLDEPGTVREPLFEVRLRPVDGDADETAVVGVNQLAQPVDYSLHPRSGPFAGVSPDETVSGWFAVTVPNALSRSDMYPAMGSGGSPLDYHARWRGVNERNTTDG